MQKKLKSIDIKNKIKKEIKNGYYIEIEYMYGDADGEAYRDIGPFNDTQKDLLYDAIETCERLISAYPHGRHGKDNYDNIDGFLRWFDDDSWYENLEKYGLNEINQDDFPQTDGIEYEPDGSYEYQATFENYKVFYYKDGEKYECKLIW